ncbi:uncharacterized protein J3R85_007191 [Psidium guajava]|nr:uncharacterized protein J3R85_007191 [Psidium guajava]
MAKTHFSRAKKNGHNRILAHEFRKFSRRRVEVGGSCFEDRRLTFFKKRGTSRERSGEQAKLFARGFGRELEEEKPSVLHSDSQIVDLRQFRSGFLRTSRGLQDLSES